MRGRLKSRPRVPCGPGTQLRICYGVVRRGVTGRAGGAVTRSALAVRDQEQPLHRVNGDAKWIDDLSQIHCFFQNSFITHLHLSGSLLPARQDFFALEESHGQPKYAGIDQYQDHSCPHNHRGVQVNFADQHGQA